MEDPKYLTGPFFHEFWDLFWGILNKIDNDTFRTIFVVAMGVWFLFVIVQYFLSFGTAYRATKKGNDNGFGLFIYLIGFGAASVIPGLGLHYYIKHLPPKVQIIRQVVPQPQVIRVVEAPQQNYDPSMQGQNVNTQGVPHNMAEQGQTQYTPQQIAYMRQQQMQQSQSQPMQSNNSVNIRK